MKLCLPNRRVIQNTKVVAKDYDNENIWNSFTPVEKQRQSYIQAVHILCLGYIPEKCQCKVSV